MEDTLIPLVGMFFVIGVPALALATRFALRPLIRDLTQALGPQRRDREAIARLEERIAHLEREGRERDERLSELAEAELFRRRLEERGGGAGTTETRGQLTNPAGPDSPAPSL
ncbi:hypothetical protein [Candidatus Palauibacter sp.]|uniref:hypothetical protein n=1 Tax=Candidatus Palauibacter sp. TaxID=3101350 RepID=UPI003AF1E7CE